MLRTLIPNPLSIGFRRGETESAAKPEPVSEQDWAVRTLKAIENCGPKSERLKEERCAVVADIEAATQRLQKCDDQLREIDRIRLDESRARNIICGTSPESDEEVRLTAFGKRKQAAVGELQMRHRDFRANCDPVESTDDFKQLQSIMTGIADCESTIRRENDNPRSQQGLSVSEHRLRRLQVEQVDAQEKVDRYRFEYERWSEIQAAKQEAANAFAKRDCLRQEREDAALAAALKVTK